MFKFQKDKSCLLPIDLFDIEVDLPFCEKRPKKFSSYQLPDFSDLFYTNPFARLGLYFNHDGIGGRYEVDEAFTSASYPEFAQGDALELFIATKNMKGAHSVSRFCHHFVIFPVEIGGVYAKELTHFRQEDGRAIFDPLTIDVEAHFHKKSYELEFFIHKQSLYGFDQKDPQMSLSYLIHSPKKGKHSFSASVDHVNLSQRPSLWAVMELLQS